jgi:hypothetical protein
MPYAYYKNANVCLSVPTNTYSILIWIGCGQMVLTHKYFSYDLPIWDNTIWRVLFKILHRHAIIRMQSNSVDFGYNGRSLPRWVVDNSFTVIRVWRQDGDLLYRIVYASLAIRLIGLTFKSSECALFKRTEVVMYSHPWQYAVLALEFVSIVLVLYWLHKYQAMGQ